jgi:hypothetical protein
MPDTVTPDLRRAVVNALCGPLGSDLADAYLNDIEFKAWVDSRVDDLLVLTDRAYAASINRREAHRVAMRTAQAGPSPHAVADLTRTEPRPRFDPNSVLS